MHSTHPPCGSNPAVPVPRPGIPARTCQHCGEFLPHGCTPDITITGQNCTGPRTVTITGRAAGNGGDTA